VQTNDGYYALLGSFPIILLGIVMLVKNQRELIDQSQGSMQAPQGKIEKIAWKVLHFKPLAKFSIIFVLCLPVLVMITALLLLAGQKPDSLIRAFTDTYKHGFSEWDYQCANVQCGGHYLCSVAANGHARVVKPKRYGVRNGHPIICNRQLLVSNAFEDLVQEQFPFAHKHIRRNYDKVGDLVHRYYGLFSIKWFADCIYILMKPLEWFFLLTLYTFDRTPENRIAKQYISQADRLQINSQVI